MQFIKRYFLLTLLILLLLASSAAAMVKNLSPGEARELLRKNPQVYILDVRTLQEYQRSRLEGARLIPIDQIARRIGEVPSDRPILVYCAVGSRSSQVAGFLDRQNPGEIYNLFGGIWGWQLAGHPTQTGGP
ncbi:MAG: rhodanese-like domain-containing protein [Desulfuromonadales bacterium]|jgi:rhodanese-related sulfurtransferase